MLDQLIEVILYGFIFAACIFLFEKRDKKGWWFFFKQAIVCCIIIGFVKLISFFIPSSVVRFTAFILIPLFVYGIIRFQWDAIKDAFKKKN